MANDEIMTPVQLSGRGLVNRISRHFAPGEFLKFTNLYVTPNGTLKKRPGVHGVITPALVSLNKCIGYREHRAVITTWPTSGSGKNQGLFDVEEPSGAGGSDGNAAFETALQAKSLFGAGTRQFGFEAFFQYNNRDHFIVWHGLNASPWSWKLYVASKATTTSGTQYPLASYTIGDQIHSQTTFDPINPTRPLPGPLLGGWVLHKDRLFVAVEDTVYFSKTADFLEWQIADDGGFFKFPGKKIKQLVSINDTIYVVFDSQISIITYSRGPNLDAQTKTISENVGGETAVGYEGLMYTFYNSSIYAVSGSNVSKLLELDFEEPMTYVQRDANFNNSVNSKLKLVCYKGGLYLLGQRMTFTEPNSYHLAHWSYTSALDLYRIDLENGCLAKIVFNGDFNFPITDMIFVPIDDKFNSPRLVMLGAELSGRASYAFFFGAPVLLTWGGGSSFIEENYIDSFGGVGTDVGGDFLLRFPINVELHVSAWSPEQLNYYISKFRTISLQGDFPKVPLYSPTDYIPELELRVQAGSKSFDFFDANPAEKTAIIETLLADADFLDEGTVISKRYGLNQRAKTLDIIIRSRPEIVGVSIETNGGEVNKEKLAATYAAFELVDLAVTWTKTKRASNNSTTDYS